MNADAPTLAYFWCKLNVYEWPFDGSPPERNSKSWAVNKRRIEAKIGKHTCLEVWNALKFCRGPSARIQDVEKLLAKWSKAHAKHESWP